MNTIETRVCDADLVELVYREAELIDQGELERWVELFAEDGMYWIPLAHDQLDGLNSTSLLFEDKFLLRLRVERLKNPRAFSQHPVSHCLHVLQQPTVVSSSPAENEYRTRCKYVYIETRGDDQQVFGCTALHTFALRDGELKIVQKRIHLLNCDAPLRSIQLFM
ncbi:2-halobenzoate 1,2-dioxygenase small subunit [compost metagenome]